MRPVKDDPKLPATALHYSVLTFYIGGHCELNFCLNLYLYSHIPNGHFFFSLQKSVCQLLSKQPVSLFGRYKGKMRDE